MHVISVSTVRKNYSSTSTIILRRLHTKLVIWSRDLLKEKMESQHLGSFQSLLSTSIVVILRKKVMGQVFLFLFLFSPRRTLGSLSHGLTSGILFKLI